MIDIQKQALIKEVNAKLNDNTWTVQSAVNILVAINYQKQGNPGIPDLGLIGQLQEYCAKLIHEGIESGWLRVIDPKSAKNNENVIAASASASFGLGALVGGGSSALSIGTGIATGVSVGAAAPLLAIGGLAVAAYKWLPSKRKKEAFFSTLLLPSDVAEYAKLRKKWLDEQLLSEVCSPDPTVGVEICGSEVSDKYDSELMAEAEKMIAQSHRSKKKSDSQQAQNACAIRPHIRYAKVQAAYHTLLHMKSPCICISLTLETLVYQEIVESVKAKYPNTGDASLKDYVKAAVNLVMKTDAEAITRIFKLKDHWDSKWLATKCEQPNHPPHCLPNPRKRNPK